LNHFPLILAVWEGGIHCGDPETRRKKKRPRAIAEGAAGIGKAPGWMPVEMIFLLV
jgi:hypothetical protein